MRTAGSCSWVRKKLAAELQVLEIFGVLLGNLRYFEVAGVSIGFG